MAARKNRGTKDVPMSKEWREKIKASQIANRFYQCFNGEISLTNEQLRAGEALFKRLEPELSRIESKTKLEGKLQVEQLTKEQRDAIVRANAATKDS